jgi:hypothetical protein
LQRLQGCEGFTLKTISHHQSTTTQNKKEQNIARDKKEQNIGAECMELEHGLGEI